MKLIDKYVAEVGRHLPLLKGREDIEKELKSTLEDMLDERRQAGVSEEAQVIQLLKEFGSPQKVASTYNPHPYLIGPKLFPLFLMVLKIVVSVVVAVLLVLAGVRAMTATPFMGAEFVSIVGKGMGDALSAAIAAFGNVVLVFAILERFLPAKELDLKEEEWNPADLVKEPDPDQVKTSEAIFTIIFTVIGLALFNLYPDKVGMFFNTDGEWAFIPVLSKAFFTYLPWINLLGILQITFHLYQIRQGVWTTFSRLFNIVIEVGSIALAVAMLRGPSLIDLSAEKLTGTPVAEAADVLEKVMNFAPSVALIVVIIVAGIEVAQMAYRLFTARSAAR